MAITMNWRAFTTRSGAWPIDVRIQKPLNMLRLAFLAMLVLLAAPAVSEGQQSKAVPRLCLLVFERYTLGKRPGLDAFLQTLRDLGHVDGRSIIIDYLSAEERNERFPTIAAECLHLKADVIATTTTPAALAAKNATRTIPIVMIAPGDPALAADLVQHHVTVIAVNTPAVRAAQAATKTIPIVFVTGAVPVALGSIEPMIILFSAIGFSRLTRAL